MHARMRSMGMIAVVAATLAALAPAAGADGGLSGESGTDTGGSNHGGRFSAWAYYAQAVGGGQVRSNVCHLERHPELPAHFEYNVVPAPDGKTYTVFYDCVLDGRNVDDTHHLYPTMGEEWDWLDTWTVTPAPPEEMIAEAIARLNPAPPTIKTSPGGGVHGLVNLPVYLSFAEPPVTQFAGVTDGPITVLVWAKPNPEYSWDTGDGQPACNGEGPAGTCTHLYSRSSAREGPAGFHITATISYTGGYVVTANGVPVGNQGDIGDITRVSEIDLPVDEAQAINDGG